MDVGRVEAVRVTVGLRRRRLEWRKCAWSTAAAIIQDPAPIRLTPLLHGARPCRAKPRSSPVLMHCGRTPSGELPFHRSVAEMHR